MISKISLLVETLEIIGCRHMLSWPEPGIFRVTILDAAGKPAFYFHFANNRNENAELIECVKN